MKLVDILARELKEWPADCTAGYCAQDDETTKVYFGGPAKSVFLTEISEDSREARVSRAQWQAAVDALKTWGGEGLPPVGALVENKQYGGVTVLAHGIFRGKNVVICQGDDTIITCTPDALLPIRTAEQIAAEEREKACNEMASLIGRGTFFQDAEALYDAGYRKQEQSK